MNIYDLDLTYVACGTFAVTSFVQTTLVAAVSVIVVCLILLEVLHIVVVIMCFHSSIFKRTLCKS